MKEGTLYIDILKKLSFAGIGFECEIIDLFEFEDLPKDKFGAIGLLETMQGDKHITYTSFPEDIQNNELTSIKASITFSGLDWLINYDTSIKTQNSFKNQRAYNFISATLIGISIIVSAILNHSSFDKRDLDKHILTLQLQLIEQKAELNKVKDSLSTLNKPSKETANTISHKNP